MVLKGLYKARDTASTHTELIRKISLFLRPSNFGDENLTFTKAKMMR